MDGDGFFLGAYATSPSLNGWNEDLETRYYDALKALPRVRGLEHPVTSPKLHPHDERWFLKNLDPHWDIVLTLIPGTMGRLAADPHHGLASDNAAGRAAALAFTRDANIIVQRLNDAAGRKQVVAVELHSAPRRTGSAVRSSRDSLARSLEEIATWDWQGARLCLEHCDAPRPGHDPIKGFLLLEDEIAAITAVDRTRFGIIVNWGRSVLETRDAGQAVRHIETARDESVLTGIIFSGCSNADTPWGVWDDTHMPHAPAPGIVEAAEHSLMTEDAIARAISAAGSALDVLGAKITAFPSNADLERRVNLNRDVLVLLDRVQRSYR